MEVSSTFNQPTSGNTAHSNFPGIAPVQKPITIWPSNPNSGIKMPAYPIYPGTSKKKEAKPLMPPMVKPAVLMADKMPNAKANPFPGKMAPVSKGSSCSFDAMGGVPVSDWGTSSAPAMPASAISSKPDVLHCPPQQGGNFSDPQTVQFQDIYKPIIVQHFHPMHTQVRTHYIYEHQHFYPHTMSQTCDSCHHHVQCGRPCFPQPHC